MKSNSSTPLSLIQIAAWQLQPPLLQQHELPFVAELPSLQRESVWKPSQIELLWDSIFRGFPIGSLVVSKYLDNQKFRSGSVARPDESSWSLLAPEKKRALLDGQQRCNAIALGFMDPWAVEAVSPPAILWIDLSPEILPNSTRQFLFRATTQSHPWGYQKDDSASRLNTAQLRHPLDKDLYHNRHGRNRIKPDKLYPFQANLPVPLAWLLESTPELSVWDSLKNRCADFKLPWQERVHEALSALENNPDLMSSLQLIEIGLANAHNYELMALQVPDATLEREGSTGGISCIENLFERLNNGGTRISSEDLAYSMIKAYWPGIEARIDGLKTRPISASKLFQLGVRASISDVAVPKIHEGFGIQRLRRIALTSDGKDTKDIDLKNQMLHYFGISENGSTTERSPFVDGVTIVESWLVYHSNSTDDFGLPPIVRSQIVQRSPLTYLLLLLLAKVCPANHDSSEIRKGVLALATSLHWFTGDQEPKAIERILKRLPTDGSRFDREFFAGIWEDFSDIDGLILPPIPERLREELPKIAVEDVDNWSWEKFPVPPGLNATVWNREFLLYSQRAYLESEFQGFDAAEIKVGDDHNRPWDYDHLLPQCHFYNRKTWKGLRLCQAWGRSIGNLHILPFEVNRGRGNKPLDGFLEELELEKNPIGEIPASIYSKSPEGNDLRLIEFVNACQTRISNIYSDWFETLDISFLLGNAADLKQRHDEEKQSLIKKV